MLEFLYKYADNKIFSQNGEEGLLIECLKRMNIEKSHCVEIGAADGRWCSNTALLIDKSWSAHLIEKDFDQYQKAVENWKGREDVKVTCSLVDASNVNAFVDERCDVFSSDTDGSDYEIFEGLTSKPKIVIVEINSSIPPDEEKENGPYYKPMVKLGISKGYFLLVHTGNLIFIDNKYRNLFPEIKGNGLKNADKYFRTDWLKKEVA